jgi:hypothetical protein
MQHRTVVAGVVLIVAAGVLTACGDDGVTTDHGDLDKASARSVLTQTESAWRQRIDADGGFTVHKAARCYVATRDGKYTGQVICGAARRAGSQPGQVWTIYPVPVNGDAAFGQVGQPVFSQSLPKSVDLWRPDGKEMPDDAGSLDAPPLPTAAAGLVSLVRDLPTETPIRQLNDARLVAPDFTMTVTGVTEVNAIPGAAVNQQGTPLLGPAPGEKFVLARVAAAPLPATEEPALTSTLTPAANTTEVFVTVGEKRTPVALVRGGNEQNLLLSVPATGDAPILLGTRTGNKEQTVRLADGGRASAHPGMYRATPLVKVDRELPDTRKTEGQFTANYAMKLPMVVVSSWDRYLGWAPDGMTWVRVPYQSKLANPSLFTVKLKPGSITVTGDGKVLEDRTPAEHWRAQNNGLAIFAAPGDVKAVHVKAAPVLTISGSDYSSPKTADVSYGVVEFDVTFP